jgi:hypothetical protein
VKAKLYDLGLSVKEATTEFCRPVAAVVAVASFPELVAHPFGFSLVVATVDFQNSVAAAVSAASSLGLFSFGSCCNPSAESSCNNNYFSLMSVDCGYGLIGKIEFF